MAKKQIEQNESSEAQEAKAGGASEKATFHQPQAPEGQCVVRFGGAERTVQFSKNGYTTTNAEEIEALRGLVAFGIIEE